MVEAHHLADLQVGHAMLEGVDLTIVLVSTLHGDGTTKYHGQFQNFQLTAKNDQTLSAGLLETVGRNADSALKCWKERVQDIAEALADQTATESAVNEKVDLLLASINNTMSNQCATNGAFNCLLLDVRSDVLPKVVENWDNLSTLEKSKLNNLNNFFL